MNADSYGGVEHASVDDVGFNERTCTFYVGHSWRRFVVHADIVAPHSRVLRQLIEGSFREGIERHAELPEVHSGDFSRFLAYAYNTSNTTSISETIAQVHPTQRTSTSRLIELLLANEHKNFRCKSCHNTPELKFSTTFPKCDECIQDELRDLQWLRHCVVLKCERNGEYIHGLICAQCLQALGVLSWGSKLADDGARKPKNNISNDKK